MVELANDEESLVRVEGMELMTEYCVLMKRQNLEEDFAPGVEKMFRVAIDPLCDDEVRTRMARLAGKILDRFSTFVMDNKYHDMFIQFFKAAINDK